MTLLCRFGVSGLLALLLLHMSIVVFSDSHICRYGDVLPLSIVIYPILCYYDPMGISFHISVVSVKLN